MRTGRDPDIFGDDEGQRQDQPGLADDHKALQQVPFVGRQVDRSEDDHRAEPGQHNGRASSAPAVVRLGHDGEEGQDSDNLLAEQLDTGPEEEQYAPDCVEIGHARDGFVLGGSKE